MSVRRGSSAIGMNGKGAENECMGPSVEEKKSGIGLGMVLADVASA